MFVFNFCCFLCGEILKASSKRSGRTRFHVVPISLLLTLNRFLPTGYICVFDNYFIHFLPSISFISVFVSIQQQIRSSLPVVFCKKSVLKRFSQLSESLFNNKIEAPRMFFSCEFCNIFKHTFFTERSSHQRCFVRKGVLRNFAKFTGKHLCQSLFFNKVAGLRPEVALQHGCSSATADFQNTFF